MASQGGPNSNSPGPRRVRWPVISALSYSGGCAGLYVVGAVMFLAQLGGMGAALQRVGWGPAIWFTFLTATAVYLLDRVKVRDAWLDPADAQAHPARYAFVSGHSRMLRCVMVAMLAVATWLGLGLGLAPWGGAIPALAAGGVIVYAGRPRGKRARPKDVVLLKNVYVAGGITAFAGVVVLAASHPGSDLGTLGELIRTHWAALAMVGAHLGARVIADAVLCDLDDEDTDRMFGTQTLPTRLGRARAWNIAMAIRLCSALVMAMSWGLETLPRLAWAGVTVVTSIALRVIAPRRVRDIVDVRFAVEAAAVWVLAAMWGG